VVAIVVAIAVAPTVVLLDIVTVACVMCDIGTSVANFFVAVAFVVAIDIADVVAAALGSSDVFVCF